MNSHQWDKFVLLWESGKYEEAVNIQLEENPRGGNAVVNKLFRTPGINSSTTITGFSFMDILYDYIMINPVVIDSVDFARSEDLASFFAFQQFAESFDFENVGELTRLKGYTAEKLIALELQGKGHDVQFPETSNQAGYDLLVDGKPFQVKCLSEPSGVYEHFRQYPDIPVLVNKELMSSSLVDHPLVYGTEVTNQTVVETTRSSLEHAAEFSNLDIPLITVGIASLTNGYKVITGGLSTRLAGLNIANETASRSMAALAGKGIGVLIGPLFGPAGAVVMPMVLGMAGGYKGKSLSSHIKKLYTQKERNQVLKDLESLLTTVLRSLPEKEAIKKSTYEKAENWIKHHQTLKNLLLPFRNKYKEKLDYIDNKKNELTVYLNKVRESKVDLETEIPHILDTVLKSQVHPHLYQLELTNLGESYKKLIKI